MPLPSWEQRGDYRDIIYEVADGIARITINRPECATPSAPRRSSSSPGLRAARDDVAVGVDRPHRAGTRRVLLRGRPEDPRRRRLHGRRRRRRGRAWVDSTCSTSRSRSGDSPSPSLAQIAGYAIGGGHILHLVCDLSLAADNARFGQTGPRVGSFDGGYGSSLLARTIGLKRAKEVWFLCRQYDAATALEWGLVNTVVPLADLERETVAWCRQMLTLSPIALRMLKAGFNAADDGLAGVQQLAGDATMLFYMSEEGQEGRNAYVERRDPGLLEVPQASMSPAPGPVRRWVLAARPRTLPASLVPVAMGAALVRPATLAWGSTALCAAVALSLQVGTNYANDYSDGVRGTDEVRVGPFRLTASRLVAAHRVRDAAWGCFALAGVAGLWLAARTSWWLVAIGADRGPRRLVLHRRTPSLRLLRLRRALRLRVLRPRRHGRHRLRPAPAASPRRRGGWAWRPVRWRARCWRRTTCATSRATGPRARRPWPRASGESAASWLYVACVAGAAAGVALGGEALVGLCVLVLYVPALRLAFSARAGRGLIPLLVVLGPRPAGGRRVARGRVLRDALGEEAQDRLGASTRAVRGARRGRRRRRGRQRPEVASAIAAASGANFASSPPASTRVEMRSAASSSPSHAWVPVPARRSDDARPSASVLRAARSRGSAGRAANMGWASHSSRNDSTPRRDQVSGERLVALTASRAVRLVADPPRGAQHHEALDARRVSQRDVERDTPAEGVATEGDRLVADARRQEVRGLLERRRNGRGAAVARQVQCPDLERPARMDRNRWAESRVWVNP